MVVWVSRLEGNQASSPTLNPHRLAMTRDILLLTLFVFIWEMRCNRQSSRWREHTFSTRLQEFNTWRTFLVKKIEHSFPFGRFVFMVACYEGYEGFCAVLCSCWRNCSPWAAVDIFCTTPWIPIIHTSDHLHALFWRSLAFAMLVHRAPWRFPGYLWDVESTRRYQDKQANIISQICAMFSTPPLTFCALSPITHRQA